MYVLDTCIFSLYFVRENPTPPLKEKILATPDTELWITSITVEEGLDGAFTLIRKRDALPIHRQDSLVLAYDLLEKVFFALHRPQHLPFDAAAFAVYKTIPSTVRKGRTRDCRIASVAVSMGYTVVTRNTEDFKEIKKALPSLQFVDWSRPANNTT